MLKGLRGKAGVIIPFRSCHSFLKHFGFLSFV